MLKYIGIHSIGFINFGYCREQRARYLSGILNSRVVILNLFRIFHAIKIKPNFLFGVARTYQSGLTG